MWLETGSANRNTRRKHWKTLVGVRNGLEIFQRLGCKSCMHGCDSSRHRLKRKFPRPVLAWKKVILYRLHIRRNVQANLSNTITLQRRVDFTIIYYTKMWIIKTKIWLIFCQEWYQQLIKYNQDGFVKDKALTDLAQQWHMRSLRIKSKSWRLGRQLISRS